MMDGAVTLGWTPGTGDESAFLIERDCGSGFVQIGNSPGNTTTYSDTTMPNSTPCTYQIKGHKGTSCPWTSPPSSALQVLAPPDGPVLTATAVNPFQIRLDWSNAAGEQGYEVEVRVVNGTWVPLASLLPDTLSYTDSHGVNPGTRYTYRVRATRAGAASAWGEASATTPAYTPGAATCPLP
jgi:titin